MKQTLTKKTHIIFFHVESRCNDDHYLKEHWHGFAHNVPAALYLCACYV